MIMSDTPKPHEIDTPETDDAVFNGFEDGAGMPDIVTADFARKLARERNVAEDERVQIAKQLRSEKEMHARCQNECEYLREALAIKERTLDYYREKILRDGGDWREDAQ